MSPHSLIAELEESLSNGNAEKRVETLRRLTGLFLGESERLSEQQIGVFDDVLVHLIQRIETQALVQLSSCLAPVDKAPVEVIRRLSRSDEITVAGPVLRQSARLSDDDLIEIASTKGQRHMLAMSERHTLGQSVTDVLIERGDREVHHALAMNATAQFSEYGYASLVNISAGDDALMEKLGQRLDMPLQLLRELLLRATDLVRARLLASAQPEKRGVVQQALAEIAGQVMRESSKRRDFSRAEGIVESLNRHGRLNEAAVLLFVKENLQEEITAALALFCGAKCELIERMLKNVNPEGLVIVCKAAKLSWPTTRLLLERRFASHTPSEAEIDQAKDAFLQLSQMVAQRSMRFMQVQDAARKAG